MKAAVLKGKRKLVVEQRPIPQPGSGQVLVEVSYCGICGSDLHIFDEDSPPTGIVMGHEWAGTVADVGAAITDWKIGDRVTMGGLPPGSGEGAWSPEMLKDSSGLLYTHPITRAGGYAEFLVWDARGLIAIPEGVSDKLATLTDTLGVGLSAVESSGLQGGERVVIIGAGPIGLCTLLGVGLAGAGRIYVLEKAEARKRMARALGADQVLDPREVDVRKEVFSLTHQRGVDLVFECAGVPTLIQQAVEMVRTGGRVMLVGVTTDPAQIMPLVWFWKGVEVHAVPGGNLTSAMTVLSGGEVDAKPLITGEVSLMDIQEAFEALLEPSDQVKVLVCP